LAVGSIAPLVKSLRLSFTKRTGGGFYLRAESFFNVARTCPGTTNQMGVENASSQRITTLVVDARRTRRYSPVMKADIQRFTLLKRILSKFKEVFNRPTDVHYTSVPIWRPWRRF
jgi:hypothetical protein